MADVLADPAVEKCRTEVDDAAERKCPVVGILTGISYISGVDYYQGINKQATQLLPPGKNMRNFPEMAMVSVNCAKYVDMLTHEDLTQAEDYLCGAVAKLPLNALPTRIAAPVSQSNIRTDLRSLSHEYLLYRSESRCLSLKVLRTFDKVIR
eukprot:GEMP01119374.1.p1 GENE.GEMP01119374.1~~GEMP01119374.1.p1  ORF type:complete len:172 (+),score=25.87 GEMP01119374.1:62-517(+)